MQHQDIKLKDLTKDKYDRSFAPTKEYEQTLPDIQNQAFESDTPIEWVGMAGIRRPLELKCKNQDSFSGADTQVVQAYIIGQVDCESNHRGINMSRLNRELVSFDTQVFNLNRLETILDKYCNKLERTKAMLSINFDYRLWQEALRSVQTNTPVSGKKEGGWQYYNVTFDLIKYPEQPAKKFITVDYIYSSHCPCSTDLSEHAGLSRGVKASPHAQRSIARVKIELEDDNFLYIEDIVEACRKAVPSQVQIFVKRVDEQAFAELCAAEGTVFVEDAIRLFDREINKLGGVRDYKIVCLHAESLHPWGAHAVRLKKGSNFEPWVSVGEIRDLNRICAN